MKILVLLSSISILACTSAAAFTDQQSVRSSDNAELTKLFNEDQGERTGKWKPEPSDRRTARERDHDRLVRVAALVNEGAAKTANDYFHAAIVYQHGATPADYLSAHELAVLAAARGNKIALWLSAASLDRYLISIGQPQVFGTQFNRNPGSQSWTMEPYDRSMPDVLRTQFDVLTQTEQQKQLAKMNERDKQ